MFVFDTSAFLNGWHDHLPPSTFGSVWTFIAEGMDDGRIIAPREVLTELRAKDDEVSAWARERSTERGFAVVTYEGRTFSGVPTTKWWRQMPGICQELGVACVTLPESLTALGGSF